MNQIEEDQFCISGNGGQNVITFPVLVKVKEIKNQHICYSAKVIVGYRANENAESELVHKILKTAISREIEDNVVLFRQKARNGGINFLISLNQEVNAIAEKKRLDLNINIGAVVVEDEMLKGYTVRERKVGDTSISVKSLKQTKFYVTEKE